MKVSSVGKEIAPQIFDDEKRGDVSIHISNARHRHLGIPVGLPGIVAFRLSYSVMYVIRQGAPISIPANFIR